MTAMMGAAEMLPLRLVGRLDEPAPTLDFETSYAYLTSASPQLQAAQIRINHAQQELRREKAAVIPNVTLQTVTEFDHTNGSTSVSTLLAAPVPLYNRNQGNISHAFADIREAAAEAQRVRLVLYEQLADSFVVTTRRGSGSSGCRRHILSDAEENLRLVVDGKSRVSQPVSSRLGPTVVFAKPAGLRRVVGRAAQGPRRDRRVVAHRRPQSGHAGRGHPNFRRHATARAAQPAARKHVEAVAAGDDPSDRAVRHAVGHARIPESHPVTLGSQPI